MAAELGSRYPQKDLTGSGIDGTPGLQCYILTQIWRDAYGKGMGDGKAARHGLGGCLGYGLQCWA